MFIRNFLNQFIMLSVFFHSFSFISSGKVLFTFCNMCLLILPISFFTGFSNLVVGQFKKFSLWSFNMMKLLPVSLISILSMMFAPLVCLIPSLFIFVAVHLSVFLYFDVIAFCKRLWILFFTKAIHIWHFVCSSQSFVWWSYSFQNFN